MANKREDAAAAKAKKQKIVLVAGGVLLVGLAAIQGPKLLKGSSSQPQAAPAAASTETAAPTTVIATTPTPSGGSAVVVSGAGSPRATAVLAGVTIQGGGAPTADASQLVRFSLFEVKDPFVPQASDKVTGSSGSTATTTPPPTTTTTPAASAPPAQAAKPKPPVVKKPAAPKLPTTNATILINGKANYVALKDKFPTAKPLFVVTSLTPTVARIGVAGGEFKRSNTIALTKGKRMTLVNDETGARYVLKLVYTGSAPEQTASFTQAEK